MPIGCKVLDIANDLMTGSIAHLMTHLMTHKMTNLMTPIITRVMTLRMADWEASDLFFSLQYLSISVHNVGISSWV